MGPLLEIKGLFPPGDPFEPDKSMAKARVIHTVGTSTRSRDEFFRLLNGYGIKAIVDIRRFPKSHRYPHFSKESLQKACKWQGLDYIWLGDLLGGFRAKGYESYRKSESYLKGLAQVEEISRREPVVLVCAERFPWKCHRLQVARDLEAKGWKVVHIIERDRVWASKEAVNTPILGEE